MLVTESRFCRASADQEVSMKSFLASSALALASMMSMAQKIAGAAPGEARVEVATLRNSKGHVLCTLFDSEDAYRQLRPAMRLVVEPMQPVTECVFHNVPPGAYMISAVHDENDDGKLDKGLFGMPKEGYGVSNNHTYTLKGPEFAESVVQLGEGLTSISIRLRYPGGESPQ
jgi:uncharacterized protein (DUF2141 family)